MSVAYADFLARKRRQHQPCGFSVRSLPDSLYPFQRYITEWALRLGRAACFADCGLGKTLIELVWGHAVADHTGRPVLILAPLAVAKQTEREGRKFGLPVTVCRRNADVRTGVNITNYEMLHEFDCSAFSGVELDESSILKSYSGKTRTQIIEAFAATPYKLACTATPSPNDFMELGNHLEFLGTMTRTAMLATYFNHDGGETSKWRLKGHAVKPFWELMASCSVMLRRPSDLGFDDTGYDLPKLTRHYHTVETEAQSGFLFPVEAGDLQERRESRYASLHERIQRAADLTDAEGQWLIWGDLNVETEGARDEIPDAVEVSGSGKYGTDEHKEKMLLGFSDGDPRVLVTKGKIAGFGMNWQNCHQMIRMGLSDSHELMYQEERRCWRFGQAHDVDWHCFVSDRDGAVIRNVDRKRLQAEEMLAEMIDAMRSVHG